MERLNFAMVAGEDAACVPACGVSMINLSEFRERKTWGASSPTLVRRC